MTEKPQQEDRLNNRDAITSAWDEKIRTPLAARWPEFVDCRKRLAAEAPFLVRFGGARRILDAAMGTGCEAVFLAKQGCSVTGNEIDPGLARHAYEFAERELAKIRFTSVDWRQLGEAFGSAQFDATLILGNSLCLLRDEESRIKTAENLRAVCKPGGSLVVDERNFDYILRERSEILEGNFRFSGRVMYCGTSIRGRPSIIDDQHVRFAYEDTQDGRILGYLDMHPFRRGELAALFETAGFTSVEVFSDFVSGYIETADFYTYVFQ